MTQILLSVSGLGFETKSSSSKFWIHDPVLLCSTNSESRVALGNFLM